MIQLKKYSFNKHKPLLGFYVFNHKTIIIKSVLERRAKITLVFLLKECLTHSARTLSTI